MAELKAELYAIPECEWRHVPFTTNRHKWWLRWYRFDEEGRFFFCFESPRKRCYCYRTELKNGRVRLTDADVALANGETIASYWALWDRPEKLDAVVKLTPKHILRKLSMLLDAIG